MMKKLISLTIAIVILSSAQAQNCPGIMVQSPFYEIPEGDTLVFVAATKGADPKLALTYNWAISAGTIISGQGTAKIMVNTGGLAGMFVTATVELGGLPAKCASTASSSIEVIPAAQLVVSGTFTNGQELKNAVQKFIAATAFKDTANAGTAFIYLYKSAATTESAFKIFQDAIIGAFEYNKVLPHQYMIVDGGKKRLTSYEFYLLLPGGKEPKPSN